MNKIFQILTKQSKSLFLTPKNCFKFIKVSSFNFSVDHSVVNRTNVDILADTMISKLNSSQNFNDKFEAVIRCLVVLGNVHDTEILKNGNSTILEQLRDEKFMSSLNNERFEQIMAGAHNVDLEKQDLEVLEDLYLEMNQKQLLKPENKLMIFNSIYYYDRKGLEIPLIKQDLLSYFLTNVDNLREDQQFFLLSIILFLKESHIAAFSPVVIKFMNKVLESNSDLSNKFEFLIYYPRILAEFEDKSVVQAEAKKLEDFIIENMNYDLRAESMTCVISNYCHYIGFRESILETYSPFFYRNLSALGQVLLLELFFLYMQSDLSKIKHQAELKTLLSKLAETIKTLKIQPQNSEEQTKEVIYYNECKQNLSKALKEWESGQDVINPSHELLKECIEKSLSAFPFAAITYNVELLEKIHSNIEEYIRL